MPATCTWGSGQWPCHRPPPLVARASPASAADVANRLLTASMWLSLPAAPPAAHRSIPWTQATAGAAEGVRGRRFRPVHNGVHSTTAAANAAVAIHSSNSHADHRSTVQGTGSVGQSAVASSQKQDPMSASSGGGPLRFLDMAWVAAAGAPQWDGRPAAQTADRSLRNRSSGGNHHIRSPDTASTTAQQSFISSSSSSSRFNGSTGVQVDAMFHRHLARCQDLTQLQAVLGPYLGAHVRTHTVAVGQAALSKKALRTVPVNGSTGVVHCDGGATSRGSDGFTSSPSVHVMQETSSIIRLQSAAAAPSMDLPLAVQALACLGHLCPGGTVLAADKPARQGPRTARPAAVINNVGTIDGGDEGCISGEPPASRMMSGGGGGNHFDKASVGKAESSASRKGHSYHSSWSSDVISDVRVADQVALERCYQAEPGADVQAKEVSKVARALLTVVGRDVKELSIEQVCCVVKALGRLNICVDENTAVLLDRLLLHARQNLMLSTPKDAVALGQGLVSLQHNPGAAWVSEYAKVLQAKFRMCTDKELSAVPVVLAALGYHPSELWFHAYLVTTMQQVGSWSLLAVSKATSALAELGARPPRAWLAAAATAARTGVHELLSINTGTPTSALASATPVPTAATGSTTTLAAPDIPASSAVPSAVQVDTTTASSRVGLVSIPQVAVVGQGDVNSSAGKVMQRARAAVVALHGLVRLGHRPSAQEVHEVCEAVQPHTQLFRPVHDLKMLSALAVLHHAPQESWLYTLLIQTKRRLPGYQPAQLASLLSSLSELQYLPDKPWIQACLRACHRQMHGFEPVHIAATLSAFARWQLQPPRAFVQPALAVVHAQLELCSSAQVAQILSSLRQLRILVPSNWLRSVLMAACNTVQRPQLAKAKQQQPQFDSISAAGNVATAADLVDMVYSLHLIAKAGAGPDWGRRPLPWLTPAPATSSFHTASSGTGALQAATPVATNKSGGAAVPGYAGVALGSSSGKGSSSSSKGSSTPPSHSLQNLNIQSASRNAPGVGSSSGGRFEAGRRRLFSNLLDDNDPLPASDAAMPASSTISHSSGKSNVTSVTAGGTDQGPDKPPVYGPGKPSTPSMGKIAVLNEGIALRTSAAAYSPLYVSAAAAAARAASDVGVAGSDINAGGSSTSLSSGGQPHPASATAFGGDSMSDLGADRDRSFDRFEWGLDPLLWQATKAVVDALKGQLAELSAEQLYRCLLGLAYVRFYPGRDFLLAHTAAASAHISNLSVAEKQLMTRAYTRLRESKGVARQLLDMRAKQSMPSVIVNTTDDGMVDWEGTRKRLATRFGASLSVDSMDEADGGL